MFVVSFEDHGKEPKNIGTAETTKLAKQCIEEHFGSEVKSEDFVVDDRHRIVFSIGDAQYVIESLQHWS